MASVSPSFSIWNQISEALETRTENSDKNVWNLLQRALTPIHAHPRVVSTLEVSHQATTAGKSYVVLRNTQQNSYLKLDPREYELLGLMDGTRTVQELVVTYFTRNGVLAVPRITALIQLLSANHFLTESPLDVNQELRTKLRAHNASDWATNVARGFVYSNFAITNMDAFMTRLYHAVGWIFFTRPAIFVGVALAVLGPLIYAQEFARGRYPLFQFGDSYLVAFVLFLGLQFITLVIHELGHAMAVKRAGRAVPRGGLLLYYGFPAGYVDTTDIWMAPRRARLVTSFAGPYTGLVLGGTCALLAYILPPGAPGAFFFAWGFLLLLNTLFNFNPLLELDGYYLLVDWLEKPALRARALSFVRGGMWDKARQRTRFTREEIFFSLFGIASIGYSVLAILLAVQFWQLRLAHMAGEAFAGTNLLAQSAFLLIATLITVPLALACYAWGRELLAHLAARLAVWNTGAEKLVRRQAVETLRAIPLWQNLPDARLLEIARAMRVMNVSAGTAVVTQGAVGDAFYVIARGTFEVNVDGERVKKLGAGDYFGEIALLNHSRRTATVIALEPGRLFALDGAVFDGLVARDLAMKRQLEAAMDYRAEIAALPLFQELTSGELDLLLTKLQPQSVAAGAVIIQQGERGDRFYIVRRGQVEITQNGRVVATRGAGEALGEIALLYNIPRTATVRALAPTELLTLNASDFLDLLVRYLKRESELQHLSTERIKSYTALASSLGE